MTRKWSFDTAAINWPVKHVRQFIKYFVKSATSQTAVLLSLNALNTKGVHICVSYGDCRTESRIYKHLFNLPKYEVLQFHSKENAKSVKRSCHGYNKTKMHAKTLSTRCHHINFFFHLRNSHYGSTLKY